MACGVGYSGHQIESEDGDAALSDAVDAGEGDLDNVAGIQPGAEGLVPGGAGGRQASTADQFHGNAAGGAGQLAGSDVWRRGTASGCGDRCAGGVGKGGGGRSSGSV